MNPDIKSFKDELREMTKELEIFEDEYSGYLEIDIYNLENDCAKHSEYFFAVAKKYSVINALYHNIQVLVKEIEAQVCSNIHNDPEAFGITKLTESQVTEKREQDPGVVGLRKLLNDAGRLKDDMSGLKDAFEHRRSMINNECELFLSKLSEPRGESRIDNFREKLGERKLRKRVKMD